MYENNLNTTSSSGNIIILISLFLFISFSGLFTLASTSNEIEKDKIIKKVNKEPENRKFDVQKIQIISGTTLKDGPTTIYLIHGILLENKKDTVVEVNKKDFQSHKEKDTLNLIRVLSGELKGHIFHDGESIGSPEK